MLFWHPAMGTVAFQRGVILLNRAEENACIRTSIHWHSGPHEAWIKLKHLKKKKKWSN